MLSYSPPSFSHTHITLLHDVCSHDTSHPLIKVNSVSLGAEIAVIYHPLSLHQYDEVVASSPLTGGVSIPRVYCDYSICKWGTSECILTLTNMLALQDILLLTSLQSSTGVVNKRKRQQQMDVNVIMRSLVSQHLLRTDNNSSAFSSVPSLSAVDGDEGDSMTSLPWWDVIRFIFRGDMSITCKEFIFRLPLSIEGGHIMKGELYNIILKPHAVTM